MGKLVGGDFLLDLSSLTFEVGDGVSFINITNEEIIKQLTNLKRFIPNPSMIKPIWVKLYNGDSDKLIVARGTLSVVDTNEFELDVFISGYKLKIHVEFTQMLNEDDDPIDDWYIATNDAKYLFTSNDFATFKVDDVKNIDGEILSQLKCGDIVIKQDASGEHAYIVTFKSETGICLTYHDASVIETQSYDLVDDEWVYNGEDKSGNLIENVKPIYYHPIYITQETHSDTNDVECRCTLVILDNSDTPYTSATLYTKLLELMNIGAYIQINGYFKDSASVVNNIYMAQKFADNDYRVYGNNTSGRTQTALENILNVRCLIADGVNKIN